MAIAVPILGVVYLMVQIQRHKLTNWQHYACLAALVAWISILCLVDSDKVQSFTVAGNDVKLVDQKPNSGFLRVANHCRPPKKVKLAMKIEIRTLPLRDGICQCDSIG
jgi:hypothetical protein